MPTGLSLDCLDHGEVLCGLGNVLWSPPPVDVTSLACAVLHGRVRDMEPLVPTAALAICPWPPASGLAGQTASRVLNTCGCTQERCWGLGLCLAKGYLALLFPTSTSLRERWPHVHPTGVPSLGSSEVRQERGRSGAACADPSVSPRPVPCSGSGAQRAS